MSRRSYRYLMSLPAFGLFDAAGQLLGAVRAEGPVEARGLFHAALERDMAYASFRNGVRVRKLP